MDLSLTRFLTISKTLFLLGLGSGIALSATRAQDTGPAPTPSSAAVPAPASAKPKKVWTNDDVAATDAPIAPKAKPSSNAKVPDSNEKLAHELRARIEKLEAQMKDTDSQLTELQNFQAGEGSGNAGRDPRKGYNRTPIPEQIEKLKQKKAQIQQQIEVAYDEARKKGIQPGQLR